MAYDSVRNQVILFGGRTQNGEANDTWSLDAVTGAWTLLTTAGPSPRSGAEMVYNPDCDRIILFGGEAAAFFDETWAWDGLQWTLMNAIGASSRANFAMAYDSENRTVVINGGSNGIASLQETLGYQDLSTALVKSKVACGSSRSIQSDRNLLVVLSEVECKEPDRDTDARSISTLIPIAPLINP